jgi:hypothetical protein
VVDWGRLFETTGGVLGAAIASLGDEITSCVAIATDGLTAADSADGPYPVGRSERRWTADHPPAMRFSSSRSSIVRLR